eukprot:1012472_1
MVMDVLYFIIGNGKTIRKSSLYMAMIMQMFWNGYVEMLLQFHMVFVVMLWRFMPLPVMLKCYHHIYIYIKDKSITRNKTKATYGKEEVCVRQEAKAQKGKREVAERKPETYSKGNICAAKMGEGVYEITKKATKGEGKKKKRKDKQLYLKQKVKVQEHIIRIGKI